MELVATLITNPTRKDLTGGKADDVRTCIKKEGWSADKVVWLDKDVACDIRFSGPSPAEARKVLKDNLAVADFDLVVQQQENRRKKLLLADMDSTIVVGETLDELADKAGIKEKVAEITARAMRGELDFRAALFERVGMLKNLPVDRLEQTLTGIALTPGARILVQTMRANGAFTVLVSGGFRFFTRHVAATAGFHAEHANELIVEDNKLTGSVAEPVLDKQSKLDLLNRYVSERQLPMDATLTTGDGANDLPMLQEAGLGVAYHAKPIVDAQAPAAIRHGDLTALLYLQGYKVSEFVTD